MEDFDDITTNTGYVDIPYKITIDDYGQIKTLRKWDTIVIKNRTDPNIRFLVTHQRSFTPSTLDIQVNAYTQDGYCIQPYDLEWPSLILVVDHQVGRNVPLPPAFKKLKAQMDNNMPTPLDDEDYPPENEYCYWIGRYLMRFMLWLNPGLRTIARD